MYNLLPPKAPYICISPRTMAGNYIDMQGSVSTDLGKLVTIQLVPKKTAENNGETATLQQENFSSFATTGNQQPYNGIYSWGTDSTLSPAWTHREQNPSVPESLRKAPFLSSTAGNRQCTADSVVDVIRTKQTFLLTFLWTTVSPKMQNFITYVIDIYICTQSHVLWHLLV